MIKQSNNCTDFYCFQENSQLNQLFKCLIIYTDDKELNIRENDKSFKETQVKIYLSITIIN